MSDTGPLGLLFLNYQMCGSNMKEREPFVNYNVKIDTLFIILKNKSH